VFIPVGACWRNLQEAWWRSFRRDALAGQRLARSDEITLAIEMATCQLNARARLWVWAPWRPHHATDDASSPTASKRTFRNLDQGDRACASAVPGSRL
jgi:hypothetical protein